MKLLTLNVLLYNIYTNNMEKEISNIYKQMERSNNSGSDNTLYKEYKERVATYLASAKNALNDDAFDEFRSTTPFDREHYKNKAEKYLSYPNKYAAYEDLKFYRGRLEVLNNRLSSILSPVFKWR